MSHDREERDPERERDSAPATPSGGTILPLLGTGGNERLLTDLVGDQYEVLPAASTTVGDADFDLCIVDDRSLAEHRELLAEIKEDHTAGFLPYLLVTRRGDAGEIPPWVQNAVDEIVTVPTTKAVLAGRIANLLERRQTEERFRLLFEAAPDPVVVVSSEGIVSRANRAFVRTFGLDEDEIGTVAFADLGFARRDPDGETDADADTHTLSWDREDGTALVMELHVSPVKQNGETLEWIGVFRDVTTSARREEGLERERQRLNGMHWSRK